MSRVILERFICFIMLLSINMAANANDDIESKMWQATLFGGLYLNNEQAWQLEPSVSWHFHKNIGIRLGLEFTSQYNQPSHRTIIDGHEAELASNERDIAWIIFKPSMVFKTPRNL